MAVISCRAGSETGAVMKEGLGDGEHVECTFSIEN